LIPESLDREGEGFVDYRCERAEQKLGGRAEPWPYNGRIQPMVRYNDAGTVSFGFLFAGCDCQTASFAKLAGLKNGRSGGWGGGFDVLITVDQGIPRPAEFHRTQNVLVIL